MAQQLDLRRRRLKAKFTKARGFWIEEWNSILEASPDFFESCMNFASVPWTKGVLPPKVKELLYLAVTVASTNLHEPGVRVHMRNAIRHGATREELLETLQLVSVLGIHTMTMGVPVLFDELRKLGRGAEIASRPLSRRQRALKAEFTTKRGYWSDLWDGVLQRAPDFFETYLRFSAEPWTSGPLDPKVKELIYIAIDASTTHLYEPGLRLHIRNALKYGATVDEIMEVYALTTIVGIQTMTMGVPIMLEELAEAGPVRRARSKP